MSTRVFRGSPNWKNGIPRNSKIRIVTLPDATVVYENDRVSEQVSVDLDPGYYHVVIKKFLGKNAMGRLSQIRWEDRFFHDLTEQEFMVLATMRPTNAKGRLLSGGWNYSCGYAGCEYSCNNPMAMVLHELEGHKGQKKEDLIKDSDYLIDQNLTAQAEAAEKATGKPGFGLTAKEGPVKGRSFVGDKA